MRSHPDPLFDRHWREIAEGSLENPEILWIDAPAGFSLVLAVDPYYCTAGYAADYCSAMRPPSGGFATAARYTLAVLGAQAAGTDLADFAKPAAG